MSVEHFDEWYSAMSSSPDPRDELANRHLGLPPEVLSTSLLSMSGLLEVRDLLNLSLNDVVLDLACGRGGYGLWLARTTGSKLIGVDFSPVAIELANRNAASFGIGAKGAEFRIGSIEATGLPDHAVDAVLCIDAIQFADNISLAAAELHRVLQPGGRIAVTCWEALDRGDQRLPERIRRVELAKQLDAAGFVDVQVADRPDWLAIERGLWNEAMNLDPGDDPTMRSFKEEAGRVAPILHLQRRVLATGHANAR